MIVDIPFYQQNPIKDEVLNALDEEDVRVSVKETDQYQELIQIPYNERLLFRKNGVSIKGQKKILDQLRVDIMNPHKRSLILW